METVAWHWKVEAAVISGDMAKARQHQLSCHQTT